MLAMDCLSISGNACWQNSKNVLYAPNPMRNHLHVEVPGQVLGLHQAVEELVHLVARAVRLVVRHHRHVLELRQIRHLERLELGDLGVGPVCQSLSISAQFSK
jgi:hypothetical protein